MREKGKILAVVNTDKRTESVVSESVASKAANVSFGGASSSVDLSAYLLKSVWEKAFEIKTDTNGMVYLFGKLPVVTQYGVTMYSGEGGDVNVPSIYDGLPIDGETLYWDALYDDEGNVIGKVLKAQGGGSGGGGVADSVAWTNVTGKPSWLIDNKISYSEIDGTPDLSVYALKSAIPSLSGYATEQWVTNKGYLTSIPSEYVTESELSSKGYATTSDLDSRVNALINGAPAAYDTLKEIADVLQGNVNSIGDIITTLGTKWTQDDVKINSWDAAFSWGNHATAGYAKQSYVDSTFVTLGGNEDVSGIKNFTNGIKLSGIEFKYDSENNAVCLQKADGTPINFYVTGGLSMYGQGNTSVKTIMDAIEANLDPNTLAIENGLLTVIGGTGSGGIAEITKQMVIEALGFTPYSAENPNGYITAASIPSALKNPYALTFGSKTYDGSSAKSITASDLGAALSSDLSKYLPLSGGTINGIIYLNHTLNQNSRISFKNNRTEESSSWAVNIMNATDVSSNVIMRFGIYGTAKVLDYIFLGHNTYSDNNLRIYADKVTFGSNTIWHAGNFNPSDYLPLSGGTLTGNLMLKSTSQSSDTPKLYFQRGTTTDGYYDNYIYNKGGGIVFGYSSNGIDYDLIKIGSTFLQPVTDNVIDLGTSSLRWANGYFDNLYATSNVGIGTTSPSAKLHVNGTALIGDNVAGGELLRFNMDRYWSFIQEESGASSRLVLKAAFGDKYFIIKNSNDEKILLCHGKDGSNTVEIGGTLRLDNNKNVQAKDTSGNNITLFGFNSSNQLSIGYGLNSKGYIMGLGGKIVNFYYGTERTLGMVLNESGNVGVAITPEYKFHVEQKTDNTFASVFQTPNSKVYLAHSGGRGMYASVLSGVSSSYLLSLKYNQTTLGSGGSSALYVRTDGNIGIGTESPAYKLDVNGIASVKRLVITATDSVKQLAFSRVGGNSITTPEGGYLRIITNGKALGDNTADLMVNNGLVTINGNILVTGGVTMQSARILKNVVDERGLSLTELSAIKPTRYTWKDKRDDRLHFGGIADDIEKVLPEVIYTTADGTLTMDYGNAGFAIASSLIKPVVDHETEIRLLKMEVKELKERLNRYEA